MIRTDLDGTGLDVLRHRAGQDPRAAARDTAVRFDALFTGMMIKSMREAVPRAEPSSAGTDHFTAMLDAQFAQQFAGRPGGLADLLEKQLARHLPKPAPDAVSVPAAPAAPAASPGALQGALDAASSAVRAPARAVRALASGGVAQPAASGAPAATGRAADFIRRMLPHAREAEAQTGVPASFILGQAALESGWGRHEIRNADGSGSFNLFGIKSTAGWRGAQAEALTTEYEGGQPVRQKAAFRSYGSYAEGFTDYARMLASQPRYAAVLRGASTAETFAGGMQRAGYATDPDYANKLTRTIRQALAVQKAMTA